MNECWSAQLHSCPTNAKCENTICTGCLPGYKGVERSRIDVKECQIGTHLPALVLQDFKVIVGFGCKGVDECKTSVHKSNYPAFCTNVKGTYSCSCYQISRETDEQVSMQTIAKQRFITAASIHHTHTRFSSIDCKRPDGFEATMDMQRRG